MLKIKLVKTANIFLMTTIYPTSSSIRNELSKIPNKKLGVKTDNYEFMF